MHDTPQHNGNSSFATRQLRGVTPPLERPLRGVIVPLVTPLRARDELDVEGIDRLVDHVVEGGVHGIFLLGTTGEAAALSGRVRRELVQRVCRRVERRIPVLVGVSDTALVESLRLAEDVATDGAAAVVVTTPYYLPIEPAELVSYVKTVSHESPLPVFLYNMPELARTWFSPEILAELADLENVVGLKDSSGDLQYFAAAQRVAARRADWSLLVGSDSLLADAVRLGAHGGVTGGANVCPKLFADLFDAAVEGNEELVVQLKQQVSDLSRVYQFGGYAVGSIRGIKNSLKQMSICNDRMAAPFLPANETEERAIAGQLHRLGINVANGFSISRIDEGGKSSRMYGTPSPATQPAWAENS